MFKLTAISKRDGEDYTIHTSILSVHEGLGSLSHVLDLREEYVKVSVTSSEGHQLHAAPVFSVGKQTS